MVRLETHGDLPVPIQKTGLNLRSIAFVLFRRRWIILAITVPIILVGAVNLLGRTGTVTAAARVLVELMEVDQPRWNITGRNIDYDREMSTMVNIAMSVAVGDLAAEALADSLAVIQRIDPKLATLTAGREFRDFLLGGLDVNVVGESNILEFRHTAENPRVALMSVGALRNAFIKYKDLGRRNPGAVDYYSEQVASVRASIDSLLAVRGEVLGRSGYTSLEDEMKYSTGMAADAITNLRKVEVERQQLEMEYNLLLGYLDRDPREFPAGQDESRASTLVGWRDAVGKHENKLTEILTVFTPESIPARQQKELLDFALKRLHDEEVAYTESIHLTLQSTKQREMTLRAQVADINEANQRLPQVYQEVSMLDSDIQSLRTLLKDLQGKWGEVRMSAMADDRVSQVVALTAPELVVGLGGGKTTIYLAMVILFGLALGLVGAFVQESLDHRIYVATDVEENLNLPVFVSITKVE